MQHLLVKEKFITIGTVVWIRASQTFSPVRTKTKWPKGKKPIVIVLCSIVLLRWKIALGSQVYLIGCTSVQSVAVPRKNKTAKIHFHFRFYCFSTSIWQAKLADFGLWAPLWAGCSGRSKSCFWSQCFPKCYVVMFRGGLIIGPGPLSVSVTFCRIASMINKHI